MLFKDHLKIVTDAGAVLHLGWDYNAPYNLDPLNGVDVDIQTAQLKAEASGTCQIKANGQMSVESSGMTQVKGSMLKLN